MNKQAFLTGYLEKVSRNILEDDNLILEQVESDEPDSILPQGTLVNTDFPEQPGEPLDSKIAQPPSPKLPKPTSEVNKLTDTAWDDWA